MSLGMRQRVKLAQALVHSPRLLLLDEPTNGLDPAARQRMIGVIRDIRDSGKVRLILSSHLLRDVEECCEEVLVLKEGRIAVYCNLEEERKAHKRFLELETRGNRDAFAEGVGRLGCEFSLLGNGNMKMVLPEGLEIRRLYELARDHEVQIRRLSYKQTSLEEIFLKAMG
jgi:ABC-2 type transport system ATP-binding protein